ncbi:MAG TPA: cation diffusion facilitator family transporter, partial [Chthonomonadales bacterium]|nr:cation diffusion facilitator family transporter [Chthonomonadales bacterium]
MSVAQAHSGCCHHSAEGVSEARVRLSLVLTMGFVVFEGIAAAGSHSLALFSDAGHNFADGLALLLSWYALWLGKRPATATRTYGYHRAGILAALVNASALMILAALILWEAGERILRPQTGVQPVLMMAVAAAAVALNLTIAGLLSRGAEIDL